MARTPAPAPAAPAGPVPRRAARSRRRLVAVLVVLALAALTWSARREVRAALSAVAAARPADLLLLTGCLTVWVLAWTGVHLASAAVVAPVRVQDAGRYARGALMAVALNSTVTSAGMAGLAAFLGPARRRGAPTAEVVAAYVLAAVSVDLGFLLVAAGAAGVLVADGRLTRADVLVGAVFLVLTGLRVAVSLAAVRSPGLAARLLRLGDRAAAALRRTRPPADPERAQVLAAAVRSAVRRPERAVVPVLCAALVDVAGVGMLLTAVAAVGGGTSVAAALTAYVLSALFATIGPLPGGLGVVEVSAGAVLVASGLSVAVASGAVLLFRLAEYWVPLALGGVLWAAARPVPRTSGVTS